MEVRRRKGNNGISVGSNLPSSVSADLLFDQEQVESSVEFDWKQVMVTSGFTERTFDVSVE